MVIATLACVASYDFKVLAVAKPFWKKRARFSHFFPIERRFRSFAKTIYYTISIRLIALNTRSIDRIKGRVFDDA